MAGPTRKRSAKPAELQVEGVDVATGVLDTIASLAVEGVEGVDGVHDPGLSGLVPKASGKGVDVVMGEDGRYAVTVHLRVTYGQPIRGVAAAVQDAVADALLSQTGIAASTVDVFVDGIVFPEAP